MPVPFPPDKRLLLGRPKTSISTPESPTIALEMKVHIGRRRPRRNQFAMDSPKNCANPGVKRLTPPAPRDTLNTLSVTSQAPKVSKGMKDLRRRNHTAESMPSKPHPVPPGHDSPLGLRSPWRHPPFNIALEEGLRAELVAKGGKGFFLCGRNEAAVIVGRNQNALAELSPRARTRGVRVYRRTSGGGAVYHDMGNLNWCWVVPGNLQDRERLLGLVLGVLRELGIPAEEGPRSGIYVGRQKIGGTASAAGKGVLLFHGTLLVSTDLEALQDCLAAHAPAYPAETLHGVPSVPSELTTLSRLHPGLDVEALETALFAGIAQAGLSNPPETFLDLEKIERMAQDYGRESWILNRKCPARNRRESK
jgi:lipoate---protein ligase